MWEKITIWSVLGTMTTSIQLNKNRGPSCPGQGSKPIALTLSFKTHGDRIMNQGFLPSFRKFSLPENFKLPFENYG